MEIIVAINSILLLLIIAYMIRFIAPRKEEPKEEEPKKEEKKEKTKLSKEDREKFEKAKKSFENLMRYDYDEVIKRK